MHWLLLILIALQNRITLLYFQQVFCYLHEINVYLMREFKERKLQYYVTDGAGKQSLKKNNKKCGVTIVTGIGTLLLAISLYPNVQKLFL